MSATEIAIADLVKQLNDLAPSGAQNLLTKEREYKTTHLKLYNEREKLIETKQSLTSALAEYKKELDLRVEKFVLPSSTEGEIENLNEQIKVAQLKYGCAKKAVELLAKAKENLTKGYLPKLNLLFSQNLTGVGLTEFKDATVDDNFSVKLLQGGQMRETGYLSTGNQEICDFLLRLSLMQCIYGQDLPLLILDDPFVNYDEDNFKRAFGLLTELSKTVQILYLTCHDR